MDSTDCCTGCGVFLMAFLPILFFLNEKFRFYVKVFVHYVIMIVACVLPIPIAALRFKNVRNTNMCACITTTLSKLFFNIQYEIRGLEHIAKDEAGVIVCNHQSSLDVIMMMEIWPKMPKCAAVVKKELIYAGPFGIVSWLSGTVFVDRSNSARAQKSLNHSLSYLTEKNIKLWFFPEGTRHDGDTMLPFKKGAFHLAIQSQTPVLPMTVSRYKPFYDKRVKKFENNGKVIVDILEPIPTKGLTVNDMESLMNTTRKKMEESLAATTKLVTPN